MKKIHPISLVLIVFLVPQGFSSDNDPDFILGKNIKKAGAESAIMKIEMLVGELQIQSEDIYHLIQIECRYDKPEWEPEISYSVEEKRGELFVSNRSMRGKTNYDDDDNSEWKLKINETLPTKLEVFLGAGLCSMNLEESKLEKLDFEIKAGQAKLNLKNTSVPNLKLKALAGEVTIDLSGEWKNDLNAYIKGGVGDLKIILPANHAVGLEISGLIGDINARDFQKDGRDYYRNPGNTEHTLYLDVNGGIGNVKLLLAE